MAYFNPNMEMPQEYIDTLVEMGMEQNISAEQYSKQIIMSFLAKNNSKMIKNFAQKYTREVAI